ncbi:hypothetical protein MRX96_003942 [Rhipicephalus microplus]
MAASSVGISSEGRMARRVLTLARALGAVVSRAVANVMKSCASPQCTEPVQRSSCARRAPFDRSATALATCGFVESPACLGTSQAPGSACATPVISLQKLKSFLSGQKGWPQSQAENHRSHGPSLEEGDLLPMYNSGGGRASSSGSSSSAGTPSPMLAAPQPLKAANGAATANTAPHGHPTQPRKYQCKMCPQVDEGVCTFIGAADWAGLKMFDAKAELQLHAQSHLREAKPYRCAQCSKAFANASYLSQHSRIHSGVKPYRCDLCDRKFTQLSHLQQHVRTHTGDKPYLCRHPGCDKAFSQLSNLQSHSRCHQADKAFQVPLLLQVLRPRGRPPGAHPAPPGLQAPQDAHLSAVRKELHAGDVPAQAHAEARAPFRADRSAVRPGSAPSPLDDADVARGRVEVAAPASAAAAAGCERRLGLLQRPTGVDAVSSTDPVRAQERRQPAHLAASDPQLCLDAPPSDRALSRCCCSRPPDSACPVNRTPCSLNQWRSECLRTGWLSNSAIAGEGATVAGMR